jgi:hypothetical protein
MKPRPVESEVLTKAREMAVRLDTLEKARDCPKCDDGKLDKMGNCMKMGCGGPTKMQKASMSGKDKYCMKNFGKKYSECTEKQKAQCDKAHNKVEKAEGEQMAEKITNVNPHFMTETGGQTRTAYYSTRDRPIETEDAKPKRKKADKKVDMEGLASRMNPHEGTGVDREDAEGESAPLKKSRDARAAAAAGMPVICKACGGTPSTGCGLHPGMDIFACPQFEQLM